MVTMSPQEIGELIRGTRKALGVTQAELAEIAGVGRRFVLDVEAGHDRAELRKVSAVMRALGFEVHDEPDPITTVRTPSGLVAFRTVTSRVGRPLSVPNRLWTVDPSQATATVSLPSSVYWSGGDGVFDLGDIRDRTLAYRTLMLEGTPAVIVQYVDGGLLADMWDSVLLPPDLRRSWQPAVGEFQAARAG